MANGIQVIGDAGNIQIDDTYSNLALVASGVATLTLGFGSVTNAYTATVTYVNPISGTFPLVALRPHDSSGVFDILKLVISGNTFTWTIMAGGRINGGTIVNKSFDYFILNTPPVGTPEAWGIQVFDSSGNKTFDSGYRYVRVLSVTETTYAYMNAVVDRSIEVAHPETIAFIPASLCMETDSIQEITGDIFYTYYYRIVGFRILSGSTLQIVNGNWGSETITGPSDGSGQFTFRKQYCSVMAIALDPLI